MKLMDVLAAARPANLEGRPDPDRRHRDLEKALSLPADAPRPTRSTTRLKLGIGVVAVGAAGAVAIAVVGQSPGARPAPKKSPGDGRLAGQPILLAAARAEAQPMGQYWTSDTIWGQSYIVSAKSGKYAITGAGSETFEWTSVKPGGGNLFYGRDLPARPQTPADKAAWRKAGSPTSFRVWSNDHYQTYTRSAGAWDADRPQAKPGGRFFFMGLGGKSRAAQGVTIEDLQRLSNDPALLRKTYLALPGDPSQRLMAIGEDLMNAPVPPKLRAEIMRMIPTLPGVYSVGTVTDPLKRKGIAFAADLPASAPSGRAPGFGSRTELVFNDAGEFLGSQDVLTKPGAEYAGQHPGFVINYHIARGSAWTDKKPTSPPAKLPF